jgi:hypothetical protein
MPLYTFLHNLLNVLVQIANKIGLQKNIGGCSAVCQNIELWSDTRVILRLKIFRKILKMESVISPGKVCNDLSVYPASYPGSQKLPSSLNCHLLLPLPLFPSSRCCHTFARCRGSGLSGDDRGPAAWSAGRRAAYIPPSRPAVEWSKRNHLGAICE